MESPYMMINALRGAGLSCLFAMGFAGRPVTARWLCAKTGYSENTVAKALLNLSTENIITHVRKPAGWVLQPHKVIETLFPEFSKNLKNCDLRTLKLSESDIDIRYSTDSLNLTEGPAISDQGPETRSSFGWSEFQFDGNQFSFDRNHIQFDWNEFQSATEALFGEPVLVSAGSDREKQLALALVAEAYHNRMKLSKPARVVYANLKSRRRPFKRYMNDPCSLLPDSFLHHLGLSTSWSHAGVDNMDLADGTEATVLDASGESEPGYEQDWSVEVAGEPIEPLDDSLEKPIDPGSSLTGYQVWERAVENISWDLSKQVCDRYLQRIVPVAYDAEKQEILVTARDEEVVLWSADRLKRTLERKLLAFGKQEVRLRFEPLSSLPDRTPCMPLPEVLRDSSPALLLT